MQGYLEIFGLVTAMLISAEGILLINSCHNTTFRRETNVVNDLSLETLREWIIRIRLQFFFQWFVATLLSGAVVSYKLSQSPEVSF